MAPNGSTFVQYCYVFFSLHLKEIDKKLKKERKIICGTKGDDFSKFKVSWILLLDKKAISPTLKKNQKILNCNFCL